MSQKWRVLWARRDNSELPISGRATKVLSNPKQSSNLKTQLCRPDPSPLFGIFDPDTNASHIIAALLAAFSVARPLFLWAEIFLQKIFDDPQEWFSHPQNQIIAVFAGFILLLVIGLEVVNLYTLIARETMPSGFLQKAKESGLMAYLAENRGMGIKDMKISSNPASMKE